MGYIGSIHLNEDGSRDQIEVRQQADYLVLGTEEVDTRILDEQAENLVLLARLNDAIERIGVLEQQIRGLDGEARRTSAAMERLNASVAPTRVDPSIPARSTWMDAFRDQNRQRHQQAIDAVGAARLSVEATRRLSVGMDLPETVFSYGDYRSRSGPVEEVSPQVSGPETTTEAAPRPQAGFLYIPETLRFDVRAMDGSFGFPEVRTERGGMTFRVGPDAPDDGEPDVDPPRQVIDDSEPDDDEQ